MPAVAAGPRAEPLSHAAAARRIWSRPAARDTLITEWLTCTHEATDRLSEGSNEPAEMIVTKVFDACSQIEEAYNLDLQHSLKLSVANADKVKAGLLSIAHKRIIAEVLALRAKIKPQEQ